MCHRHRCSGRRGVGHMITPDSSRQLPSPTPFLGELFGIASGGATPEQIRGGGRQLEGASGPYEARLFPFSFDFNTNECIYHTHRGKIQERPELPPLTNFSVTPYSCKSSMSAIPSSFLLIACPFDFFFPCPNWVGVFRLQKC